MNSEDRFNHFPPQVPLPSLQEMILNRMETLQSESYSFNDENYRLKGENQRLKDDYIRHRNLWREQIISLNKKVDDLEKQLKIEKRLQKELKKLK